MVKIFHVFWAVATGAYYPKLEFENHKNQYFSWLLRSEQVKANIFGHRMRKFTIQDWSELADFKQPLVDSGSIVQCHKIWIANGLRLRFVLNNLIQDSQ